MCVLKSTSGGSTENREGGATGPRLDKKSREGCYREVMRTRQVMKQRSGGGDGEGNDLEIPKK